MRKMFSKQQLIEMIEAYSKASPEDIQKMFDDGDVSLAGMYVRIMKAPTSTTLTDEQIAQIAEGVFIEGTFLGYKNPVLIPTGSESYNIVRGLLIGSGGLFNDIRQYQISLNTKNITTNNPLRFNASGELSNVNGKSLPSFLSNNQIGSMICRKGTLEWYVPITQNDVSSGDVIALDSNLGNALLDHLEVEINGHRCRFESEEGNYVVYSSFGEVSTTGKLTANILSYNKINGELSFNQMTFTPDA